MPRVVSLGESIATATDGTLSLWYPAQKGGDDEYAQTMDDYKSELASVLSVPVVAEPIRADGGQQSSPEVLIRRGPDHRPRTVLFDDRPTVPTPGCTTLTVYPHESRRPGLGRQLIERFVF
ncbi:MAG: hypothetical protein J07HN6_02932 [Halonotius sp. J07HN6]|nr:MAG: hypothetical protein J07HN6_02932 [Halonotius sp. J07HN6]